MTEYELKFNVDGYVYVPVRAETPEEAYTKACEYLSQLTHGRSHTWLQHIRTEKL